MTHDRGYLDSPHDIHAMPFKDADKRRHINSRNCWCQPYNEDEGEPFVWTHHFVDFEKSGSRIH